MKVETIEMDGIAFKIVRNTGNSMVEIRRVTDNVWIGVIDLSNLKQTLTTERLAEIIGDRVFVLERILKEKGLI
jgi:hypothetical protein